jgi:hypothetical protein
MTTSLTQGAPNNKAAIIKPASPCATDLNTMEIPLSFLISRSMRIEDGIPNITMTTRLITAIATNTSLIPNTITKISALIIAENNALDSLIKR